jgi:hypothetical protein
MRASGRTSRPEPQVERRAGQALRQRLDADAERGEQQQEARQPDHQRHPADTEEQQQPIGQAAVGMRVGIGIRLAEQPAKAERLEQRQQHHQRQRHRKGQIMIGQQAHRPPPAPRPPPFANPVLHHAPSPPRIQQNRPRDGRRGCLETSGP